MEVPAIKPIYTANDFDILQFHDCHVHGLRWDSSKYALLLDLDYIAEWVEGDGAYFFWLAPAELCFEYASEVKISIDWTNACLHSRFASYQPRMSEDAASVVSR